MKKYSIPQGDTESSRLGEKSTKEFNELLCWRVPLPVICDLMILGKQLFEI